MKYVIFDNEGGNFGDWSFDNPPTRKEIIEHFKGISDDEDMGFYEPIPIDKFSLRMIMDFWNVRIVPLPIFIKQGGKL